MAKLSETQRHVIEVLAREASARLSPITRIGGYHTGSYFMRADNETGAHLERVRPATFQALLSAGYIEVAPHKPAYSNGTFWITDAGRAALNAAR